MLLGYKLPHSSQLVLRQLAIRDEERAVADWMACARHFHPKTLENPQRPSLSPSISGFPLSHRLLNSIAYRASFLNRFLPVAQAFHQRHGLPHHHLQVRWHGIARPVDGK